MSEDRETLGPCDFDGTLPGGYTAHPKRDPDTGELHAISYFFGWGDRVQYSVLGTDGRVRRTVDSWDWKSIHPQLRVTLSMGLASSASFDTIQGLVDAADH